MRPFFTVWTGQAFSLFGSQVVQFTLVWWLTFTTGSAAVLAGAAIMAFLPQVLLTPFAGVLVDRWNRRRTMIAADGSIAVVTVALMVLFAFGRIEFWHLYLAMLLRSTGAAFHYPAFTASTTLMVPKQHLARVSGLNQALQGAMGIVAPPVAALLLAFLPVHNVLIVDVATAAIAVAAVLIVAIPQPEPSGRTLSVVGDMREAFRFIRGWKGALTLVGLAMGINLVLSPAFALVPILVVNHFHGGVGEFAGLQSALGIGMVVGGLVLGVWGGFRRKMVTVGVGLAFMGVAALTLAFTPGTLYGLAVGAIFLMAFMLPMVNGPIMAIMQTAIPPGMQGRVFALLAAGASAMTPVGLALAGPVAEAFGVQVWFLAAGVMLLVAAGGGALSPTLLNLGDEEAATVDA